MLQDILGHSLVAPQDKFQDILASLLLGQISGHAYKCITEHNSRWRL